MDDFTTIRILSSTKHNAHLVRRHFTGVSLYGIVDQAVRLLAEKHGVELDHQLKDTKKDENIPQK